ncbi:MAG: alpha-L-fucosidase [Bacteroidales bacterium]|nr:alpha-L-fucosidase [Bacteroidales bacterium]
MKKLHRIIAVTALVASATGAVAQNTQRGISERGIDGYRPTEQIVQRQAEFQDMKFGIFMHFGIYSMLGSGEWVLQTKAANFEEYSHYAGAFYPSKFDAARWVAAVKASGAKYLTFTTRHHDGFSNFKTSWSDFNSVDATPFGRDIIKEIAEECHKQGIAIHFYYSLLDWGRDDYPRGWSGKNTGRPGRCGPETYFEFMKGQLTELLTNYGEIGCIWFDGHWDHQYDPDFNWHYDELYSLIHELQPNCLVANNHHIDPIEGEDIQVFERDVPGENTTGWVKGGVSKTIPLETCQTISKDWGYDLNDNVHMTPREVVRYLVGCAGLNANLLLNIGPRPDGTLPEKAVESLAEAGKWLATHGEAVYGTRSTLLPPQKWGYVTENEKYVYLHLIPDMLAKTSFCNPSQGGSGEIFIPIPGLKPKSVTLLETGQPCKFKPSEQGVRIVVGEVPDSYDWIVKIER